MRFGSDVFCVGLLLLAASGGASGQTAPPPAPQVTTGADLKQLIFDWDPVPGATHYQILVSTWPGRPFELVRDDIPAADTRERLPIASHLVFWEYVRYAVAACNDAGCTSSAEIAVQDRMLDVIGYFKASNTEAADAFGQEVALSSDGRTLAVSATREASGATGVGGDQANNDSPASGAVYVYRRSGGAWQQEAYLKAGENQTDALLGAGGPIAQRGLSISKDGSTIAVAASRQDVAGAVDAGAVYLYERSSEGSWSLAATLHAPRIKAEDFFGASVDLSLNGRMLKVGSLGPRDAEGNAKGRSHIFVRGAAGWRHSTTLAPFYAGDLCAVTRMSADSLTLVQYCGSYSGGTRRIVTLKRNDREWVHASDLAITSGFTLQQPLALNENATQMAVQQPRFAPAEVQIYRWFDGVGWSPESNFIPPQNSPNPASYGASLAFNGDGTVLAIGEPRGPYTGAGVLYPSFLDETGEQQQGVVHLLLREEQNPERWAQIAWIKAPNPDNGDAFGNAVALSGTGQALAVGAPEEDGAATGVDGDREDDSATDAGAVYLY
jgi:trimeric autotransporter adhesin